MLVQLQCWYLIDFNENMKQKFQENKISNHQIISIIASRELIIRNTIKKSQKRVQQRCGFDRKAVQVKVDLHNDISQYVLNPNINFFRHFSKIFLTDVSTSMTYIPGTGPQSIFPAARLSLCPKACR